MIRKFQIDSKSELSRRSEIMQNESCKNIKVRFRGNDIKISSCEMEQNRARSSSEKEERWICGTLTELNHRFWVTWNDWSRSIFIIGIDIKDI